MLTGFGNAESIALHDGALLIGGYRGHESVPSARLLRVDPQPRRARLKAGKWALSQKALAIFSLPMRSLFRDHQVLSLPVDSLK